MAHCVAAAKTRGELFQVDVKLFSLECRGSSTVGGFAP